MQNTVLICRDPLPVRRTCTDRRALNDPRFGEARALQASKRSPFGIAGPAFGRPRRRRCSWAIRLRVRADQRSMIVLR